MIRVSVFTANGLKLTFECKNKREADKIQSTYGNAVRLIKEANAQYEKDGNRFEYLSKCQFAINLCNVEFTRSLTKLMIYA